MILGPSAYEHTQCSALCEVHGQSVSIGLQCVPLLECRTSGILITDWPQNERCSNATLALEYIQPLGSCVVRAGPKSGMVGRGITHLVDQILDDWRPKSSTYRISALQTCRIWHTSSYANSIIYSDPAQPAVPTAQNGVLLGMQSFPLVRHGHACTGW